MMEGTKRVVAILLIPPALFLQTASKDALTLYPELPGSYPNFFLVDLLSGIDKLMDSIHAIKSDSEFLAFVEHYSIERTRTDIWTHFNWFINHTRRKTPLQAGVYDLYPQKSRGSDFGSRRMRVFSRLPVP